MMYYFRNLVDENRVSESEYRKLVLLFFFFFVFQLRKNEGSPADMPGEFFFFFFEMKKAFYWMGERT